MDFRLKERYRKVCNLISNGRRFSLVLHYKDMGPRSLLVDSFEDVSDLVIFDSASLEVPVIYDPRVFQTNSISKRWDALFKEWHMFLTDELEILLFTLKSDGYDSLVGLGPGSTPAGDDFLAGVHIGLRWVGRKLGKVISFRNLESRTTWFSSCMLRDSARGLTWFRSKKLLEALSNGTGEDIEDALNEVLSVGHTSGKAWLSGYFHSISVCNCFS